MNKIATEEDLKFAVRTAMREMAKTLENLARDAAMDEHMKYVSGKEAMVAFANTINKRCIKVWGEETEQ